MRKAFKMVAALGMVAAMAAPAMADVSLTGFYRARGYVTNTFDYGAGTILPSASTVPETSTAAPTAKSKSYVDQRFRPKFTAGDENVKAVGFFEIDSQWGDSSATVGRNQGAALQGDSINLETKNVYLWFKIPDTSVDFTVGLQNVTDSYAGVFMGAADAAGVVSNFKLEPVTFRLGYLIPFQPARDKSTSTTFYMAEAKFAPTQDVKVGANMYFVRDGGQSYNPGAIAFGTPGVSLFDNAVIPGGTTKIYMPGVDFAVNAGVAKVSGFVFGQFGDRTYFSGAAKTKISAYAGDLRADLNAGPAKVFVEGLYVSGTNYDRGNDKFKGVVTMDDFKFNSGSSTYARTDMVFLFPAVDSINTGSGLAYDANNLGLGVIHLAAGATMDVMPKTTAKLGVGYLAAAKKLSGNSNAAYFNFRNKSDMGTEVNATLNYNVTKGLDTALTGAYVFLGSAYDKSKDGSAAMDPKNPYAVIAKANYAF
ncbi:MAG TPA: hypothetical protein VGK27_10710 [Candidatus Deferrimicrobiaceae bacterium]|jgi:hypothetical protein